MDPLSKIRMKFGSCVVVEQPLWCFKLGRSSKTGKRASMCFADEDFCNERFDALTLGEPEGDPDSMMLPCERDPAYPD